MNIIVKYRCTAWRLALPRVTGYGPTMKRATSVNVRMTEEMRTSLQRLADANKRTLSDYIRILLDEHIEQQQDREDTSKRKRPAS
jgi:hypothetical protein